MPTLSTLFIESFKCPQITRHGICKSDGRLIEMGEILVTIGLHFCFIKCVVGALCRKECDGNECTEEKDERKA